MSCSKEPRTSDVEIVLHSAVLNEDFVIGLWPMQGPAKAGEPVSYTKLELHEIARLRPTPAELRALHQVKRLFGGLLTAPLKGESPLGVAA